MVLVELISGIAILATLFYYYLSSSKKFWENLGVNGPKPHLLFGNVKELMFLKIPLNEFLKNIYNDYSNEKLVGVYFRSTPVLVIRDPDLVKDVLIKDFSNFADRGMKIHEKVEPLSQHLFLLEPKRWRPLRIKLSPVFTSGKLKDMFYILKECCEQFDKCLEIMVDKGEPIEVHELTGKFTTDVIGTCAFGLNMNAFAEEDSEFRKMGKKVFKTNLSRILKMRIRDTFPMLYDLLAPIFYDSELNDFFINSIKQTMEYREKENIMRHDFVDILMEIKKNPDKLGDIEMTDSLLAAQAFVFFIAGFETSSTTLSHLLYEIAQNDTIQEKLREEVFQELKANNGDLKYESIKNMKYMHKVFQETLRKYPVVPVLFRKSAEPYTFSGTKVTIPANQKVWIPIYGIQHDPKIYPKPHIFDPERFNEDAIKSRHPMFHLPFGDGPRNCIGERFAVYQVKTGLATILQNYRIDVCEKTVIPYIPNPYAFLLSSKNGIYLKISKLKESKVK